MGSPDDQAEEALYHQWMNFSSSGQWERARDVLGELLTREPDSSWLHCKMGFTLKNIGNFRGSETHFKKSIALEPDNGDAFQGLAFLYLAMGRAGTADDHCRMALKLDPDDIDNWILMAHLCLHYDDPRQAADCLTRAERINPHDSRIFSLRTQVGAISKGPSKLSPQAQIEGYREVLKHDPENDDAHFDIGMVQLNELKDYAGAEESFRTALKIAPYDRNHERGLIAALRARDPVLKLLWAPFNFGLWLLMFFGNSMKRIWPIVILFFAWKFFIIGGFALWLIFFIFFWPMAKVYESLTIVEVHKKMGRIACFTGPMARIHRLGFATRCTLFGSIFVIFWGVLIALWHHSEARSPILGWMFSLVAAGVLALFAVGLFVSLRNYLRKRKTKQSLSSLD